MNEKLQKEIDRIQESILRYEQEIADIWKYMNLCVDELNKLVKTLKENMF